MSTQKRGIEKVINRLPNKSRFRFFLLFVLISFSFWTSTKLSKEYQLVQPFFVNWTEIPKGVVLADRPTQVNLSLKASGIEILWYRLFKRKLEVSLKNIDFSPSDRVFNFEDEYFNIQQQLLNGSELIQISPSLLPLEYSKMNSKWVAIVPQATIQLRPGYLEEEELTTIPDRILVRGPQAILDTLQEIQTFDFVASDVHQVIDQNIGLKPLSGLEYDTDQIRLYWPIMQYSEKSLTIPIEVIHLPAGVKVKLFPPQVTLRATLPLSLLSAIEAADFSLAIDYNDILENQPSVLELKLLRHPSSVKKTIWEPKTVNYLIRK
ncbi:hypothetical protein N9H57_05320 [Flavobacteriaceae bacterium]|nr:hypothetical protein [Flavobacteriaceae bacterium]MDA9571881.1 hypothetical protein [Flavobacteriaceae bacterium]MDC3354889.1 hypothetical protein [Flavobacteriaceae bacterium]